MDDRLRIDLSTEEHALLVELLDRAFLELKEEIHRTEGFAYKEGLKERQAMLMAILERVRAAAP